MAYETLVIETRDRVGLVRLNRPEARNAITLQMIDDLGDALGRYDADDGVGAIVITGDERAFAAGMDIKEMKDVGYADAFKHDFIAKRWRAIETVRKPMVAAVAGYALGGGCELAMACDVILAADTAKFGQPEINLGIIPGIGGTQRLPRLIGKSKAMEMILTGRTMDAAEAERAGLAARVVPAGELVDEALRVGAKIAEKSMMASLAAKEAVNRAFETSLAEGLLHERRLFHALFATEDQTEGMSAFVEKRVAQFRNR